MTALKGKLTRQKGLLVISLGLVVLLVAAACGGGGDNSGPSADSDQRPGLGRPPDFVEPTTVPSENVGDTLDDETTKKNGDSTVTVVEKSTTDRREIIRAALQWALVEMNIADYGLIEDPANPLISLEGLSAEELPTLPGVTLIALSETDLQEKADEEGSLLRSIFESLDITGDEASVRIGNWWVRSAAEERQFLSGGFCDLELRNEGGRWIIEASICALS